MLERNEFCGWSNNAEQHWKEEESVDHTDDHDREQQPKEVTHDKLEGWNVQHDYGNDGGTGAVHDWWQGVLKGQPNTAIFVADWGDKALEK